MCRCLVLARDRFVANLGPLYSLMAREKSPAVVTQRLMKLQTKVCPPLHALTQPCPAVFSELHHHGKATGSWVTLLHMQYCIPSL